MLRLKEKTVTKLYEATEGYRCFYHPDGGIVITTDDQCLLLDGTGRVLQQTTMGDEKDAWADLPHAYYSNGNFSYAGITVAGNGYALNYYAGGVKTQLSGDVVHYEGLYTTAGGRYLLFREEQENKLKLLDLQTGDLVANTPSTSEQNWAMGEGAYWAYKERADTPYRAFYFDPHTSRMLNITETMTPLQQSLLADAAPSKEPSYSELQVPVLFASSNYFLLENSLYRFKDYQEFEYLMDLPGQVYSLYAGSEFSTLTEIECTCTKKQGYLFDLMRVE